MNRPHPATLILLGLAVLLAASSRDGMLLFLPCLGLLLLSLLAARLHLFLLIRRSRWLLLTMLIMFGWLTPGTPLPGIPAATQEGMLLAAESLARLLVAISIVALILKALPPAELVAGMRSLLAPLALLGIPRDRIAVRLALTLEEVEASRGGQDGESAAVPSTLSLPAAAFGATDTVLVVLAGTLLLVAWLT